MQSDDISQHIPGVHSDVVRFLGIAWELSANSSAKFISWSGARGCHIPFCRCKCIFFIVKRELTIYLSVKCEVREPLLQFLCKNVKLKTWWRVGGEGRGLIWARLFLQGQSPPCCFSETLTGQDAFFYVNVYLSENQRTTILIFVDML